MLKCEICGGSDFIKDIGEFKCRGCGMAYSLEEAKKLMTGGTPISEQVKSQPMQSEVQSDSISVDDPTSQSAKKYKLRIVKLGGFDKNDVHEYIHDLRNHLEWLKNEKHRRLTAPDSEPAPKPEHTKSDNGSTAFLRTVRTGGFDKQDVLNYVDKLNAAIYLLEKELGLNYHDYTDNSLEQSESSGFLHTVRMGGFDKQDTINYIDSLNSDIYWLEHEIAAKKGKASPNTKPRKPTNSKLRTVKLGGFDKQDVLKYIDELNSKIHQLEKELNSL